jgi:rhodanese-related sulfurtransferase
MEEQITYQDIDIPTYNQQREHDAFNHMLVDVRETEEFLMGHIPGAVHIPLGELEMRIAEVPRDKPVVVVCAHGIRSVFAAQLLVEAGHDQIYNLMGGTAEWAMRRLPLER